MVDRALRFDLIARDKSFSRTLDQMGRKGDRLNRQLSRAMGDTGDRGGSMFSARLNKRLGAGFSGSLGIARHAAGAIGAAFAVAGVAQFAKDSVTAAATFDKTMRQVAAVAKIPQAQIGELRKVALDMGATTSFSAQQAGQAMLELGKGGLSFAEQRAGALQSSLTLAAAGGLELGDAASFIVQGLRTFGLRAKQSADVAAALAGAANASTSSVEDMGLSLAQAGAGARNAGLSLQETTGVLAAFANNGIRGSDAGTSLKVMLQRLVPATAKADATMDKFNLRFYDARGAMLPIAEIAEQLQDRLGGLSEAQKTATLHTIFGTDAMRAATILMREGEDGIAKYIQATSDRAAAEDLARTNTEGASGAFERLSGAIETVQIIIGDAFLPWLAKAAEWLAEKLPTAMDTLETALEDLKGWWDDNKASVETLGRILLDTFIPNTEDSDTAVKNLTTSLGTLNEILTDVTIFVLELIKVWLTLEHVTIGLISIYGSLTTAAGHVINAFDRLMGGTGHAGDQFIKFGQQVKDQATAELKEVRQAAKDAQAAIDRLHGKDVKITGTTSLQFTKSFTKQDWLNARVAAGRMAAGGLITLGSGPTADDVPIMVSKGEAVVPARAAGDPSFKAWAAGQGIPGFQLGGQVGQTGTAHGGVGKIMDRWGTLQLAALVKSLVGGAGSPAIKAWIRAQDPKPYIWGATGPGGFDCSGIVSAVLGKMLGMANAGSGLRLFTTATIGAGQYGLKSGLGGVLQIGVTPGRGHMAGRYGGLGFEAESTRTGIKVGSAASSPESFARRYHHLAKGGRITQEMVAAYATAAGVEVGGDAGRLRINGQTFDRGGWLRPGWTMAYNGTGRPEPVGGSAGVQVTIDLRGATFLGSAKEVARQLAPEINGQIRALQRRGIAPVTG